MERSVNWATVFVNATEEVANYSRLLGLLVEQGTDRLQEYMLAHLPNDCPTLDDAIRANANRLKALQKKGVLSRGQIEILFPLLDTPVDKKEVDLSLWYILITNLSSNLTRRQWCRLEHKALLSREITAENDIVRVRNLRNAICHLSPPQIDNCTFEAQWRDLTGVLIRLGTSQAVIDDYARRLPDHKKTLNYIIRLKEEVHAEFEAAYKTELSKRRQMMVGLAVVVAVVCAAALVVCFVMYVYSRTWVSCINSMTFKITSPESGGAAVSFMDRKGWKADNPKAPFKKLHTPLHYAVISHSAATGQCLSTDDCCNTVKNIQKIGFHRKFDDISYNYLVGNDGVVYEGRGRYQGAAALNWNNKIISIGFVGLFNTVAPSDNAMYAARAFLQYLVDQGVLSHNFTVYGLCQIRPFPGAPGCPLYERIKTWKGVGKGNTWSWRENLKPNNFTCPTNCTHMQSHQTLYQLTDQMGSTFVEEQGHLYHIDAV